MERKMKTLRKIRKNAKALSPVVASIILIAVTVAVSIAVAAWMGALTVGFMGSSSVNINNVTFSDINAQLAVKNTGTKEVTITSVKVNGGAPIALGTPLTLPAGDPGTIDVAGTYLAGNPYKFDLYDSTGQVVGSYQATA
jgi:flagellin-like protein